MQKHRVVAWLSQHNFPHGVVSFCDGLTHDPLRQKAVFLQSLVQEVRRLRRLRVLTPPLLPLTLHPRISGGPSVPNPIRPGPA